MRRLFTLGAVLVLAGCTSTVAGRGSAGGPPSSPGPSSSSGPSSSPDPSGSSSSSGPSTPTLADPSSADLCAGVQLAAFRQLGTPIFEPAQPAAACYLTVMKGTVASIGLDVEARPPNTVAPRAAGRTTTVAGLPVVARPPDQFTCQRDIWLSNVVVSVSTDSLAASPAKSTLCGTADVLVKQVAAAIVHGVPRRPLATPSLAQRVMCDGVRPGDLRQVAGGAPIRPANRYYGTWCRATNDRYALGVEVVFRKAAAKPLRHSTVNGHPFAWFDSVDATSIGCDVTSIQHRTTDPTLVEAIDFYLLAKSGPLRGQKLCSTMTAEAVMVLNRLKLP